MAQGIATYTGNDTIIYRSGVLSNFGSGKILEITWDDTLTEQKVGKNGSVITVYKPMGNKAKAVLKVLRVSADDITLDNDLKAMQLDFPAFTPINMSLAKRFGINSGFNLNTALSVLTNTLRTDTLNLFNGVFSKNPTIFTDVDGDVEQSYTVYEMTFGNFVRVIA